MTAKDMYGNELHVGDLIAAADNQQERKFVLFITHIYHERMVRGCSIHVSPRYLASFDVHSTADPKEFVKLQPVHGLVQSLIMDESTEPTLKDKA